MKFQTKLKYESNLKHSSSRNMDKMRQIEIKIFKNDKSLNVFFCLMCTKMYLNGLHGN